MSNLTPRPASVRARRDTARRRAQAEFDRVATAAGHGPRARTGEIEGGGSWTQYGCACRAYLSLVGNSAHARQGWVSHARLMIANPTRRVS